MARKSVIGPALVEKVGKQTHIIKIFVLFCFFSPLCFFRPRPKKRREKGKQGSIKKEDKAKKKKREETKESDTPLKFTHAG
jgi:hypothetical protein